MVLEAMDFQPFIVMYKNVDIFFSGLDKRKKIRICSFQPWNSKLSGKCTKEIAINFCKPPYPICLSHNVQHIATQFSYLCKLKKKKGIELTVFRNMQENL